MNKKNLDERQTTNLLKKGVEEVILKENLEKKLKAGKKLRIKLGIDPTASILHLGHLVLLRKLKEFQNLGHKIVLIIGDFTATIGDPSGRNKTRPPLTEKKVKKNAQDYLNQINKILEVKKTEIYQNSQWFKKLSLKKLLKILSLISLQQIIERNDFQERIKKEESLRLHEILYPLLQAYDSVMIKADLEVGGNDQKFNLLMGRQLMEKLNLEPQDILTVPLLEGLDGQKKMSKSYQNYIALNEPPQEMFNKIMALPDSLIEKYFHLLTDKTMPKNLHLRDAKLLLAEEIIKQLYQEKITQKAKENWIKTFSKKELPQEAPLIKLKTKQIKLLDLLLKAGIKSKSEAKRLIFQKAIEINGKIKNDPYLTLQLKGEEILKIGKKKFFKIKI